MKIGYIAEYDLKLNPHLTEKGEAMTDREKLIALMEEAYYCSIEELADHLLANGVVVREKGEWRNNKDNYPECDKCGYMPQYDPMIDDIYYSDFCPYCGSDMRGGKA